MSRIARQLHVNASPSRVYSAITTQEGLSRWWTRTCTADAFNGGSAELRFKRGEVIIRMRVDKLVPDASVFWTCVENNGMREWETTTLSFTLSPKENGQTQLTFVHDGWSDETEWFEHSADGWDYFLKSLKDYAETGTGSPDAGG